ncbi:MAG: type II toxin-antitoxin system PemK/MazF family toxin [candidate division KSB1 bacterium]
MARLIQRGEIWTYEFKPPDKRRPVLVLSTQKIIEVLNYVIVAPITSTIHGSPTEVIIGIDEGLKNISAVNLTGIKSIEKSKLVQFVGTLDDEIMQRVCAALAIATGCNE